MDLRGQFSQFSGVGAGAHFPNPFMDLASLSVPTNMRNALHWSEYVYSMFGTYRMAMDRIVSYFLTEIEISSASDVEKKKWKTFLNNTIGAMTALKSGLNDRMCYGNGFFSVMVPMARWLICPRCGYSGTLSEIYKHPTFKFEWQLPHFIATCPQCKVGSGYRGKWVVDDRETDRETEMTVKRWNPHEIEILHDPLTDDTRYLWRIPEDYKRLVREGHLFHLERVTKQVLEAIRTNTMFRFHKDVIFHMKEPTLAGIVNRGWGLPRILTNFRQIWHVQVLRRMNEAIALDYVVPLRIITPAPPQGSSGKGGGMMATDPLLMFNGGDFRGHVQQMKRRHMRDPADLQILPFPVNFQMFGADANKLAPRDLLDQAMETLLNDAGTPIELYNGSLQMQNTPVALRLFESTWRHLVYDSNMFLQWLVKQVGQHMSWETVEAELKRVTIADNLEQQMIAAQLMMQNQLSGTTVFGDLGYDWREEQNNLAEEATYQAKLQSRTQEEMEQDGFAQQIAKGQMGGDPAAQGGGAAAAGGGGGAMGAAMGTPMQGPVTAYLASMGPNTPQTPTDMMAVADSLAQQLMGMPESMKDSELRRLSQGNPVLHSIVKKRMEQMREESRRAAGMQGGAPPGGMAA